MAAVPQVEEPVIEVVEPSGWQRPFFIMWTGQAFSLLGSALVQFALVWWLTSTTNSAVVLATSTMVAMLPGVFLAPFAGALVDRWNRRLVMIAADTVVAVSTLLLVILFWTGAIQIWHIYLVSFVRGLGGTFHWPAMQSSTSLMVPGKHLARIQGINQALQGALQIAAPPLGALLVGLMAMHEVMMIDVLTAAVAVTAMCFIHVPQPENAAKDETLTPALLMSDIREGFRYLANWRGAMMLIGIALLINFLLSPAFVMLPLLVVRVFEGNEWHLSAINSAEAVGLVVGGLGLGAWGGFRSRMVTSLTGVVGIGVGAAIVGLAPGGLFWMAVAGMVFLGMMNPVANGPLHAILQERIAPEMQGRVFTLVGAGANAITPLAMLIAGPSVEVLGLQFWYLLSAVACIGLGILARFSKDIMSMDSGPVK